jgi:hypothetical protein
VWNTKKGDDCIANLFKKTPWIRSAGERIVFFDNEQIFENDGMPYTEYRKHFTTTTNPRILCEKQLRYICTGNHVQDEILITSHR